MGSQRARLDHVTHFLSVSLSRLWTYQAHSHLYAFACSSGLPWGQFPPLWTFGSVWRHFWLSQVEGCAAGVSWIDARGAAKHLMIYEAALLQ